MKTKTTETRIVIGEVKENYAAWTAHGERRLSPPGEAEVELRLDSDTKFRLTYERWLLVRNLMDAIFGELLG